MTLDKASAGRFPKARNTNALPQKDAATIPHAGFAFFNSMQNTGLKIQEYNFRIFKSEIAALYVNRMTSVGQKKLVILTVTQWREESLV